MPKIVKFYEFGNADVLKLEEAPIHEPGSGEIRIKVEAFALNRAEALLRQNQYIEQPTLPSRLGYDAVGIVQALGQDVSTVSVGDRIFTFPAFSQADYGVYGEWAIVPADAVIPCPENLSIEEAATLGVQYMTGYFALFEYGMLEPDQYVLITAASSSTGVAAIGLAKAMGAIVIATTRTSAKKQVLLDLGADHVVATAEENLVEAVQTITNGKGVEVIYDAVAGKQFEMFGDILAPTGKIILYGVLDSSPFAFPLFPLLLKGATVHLYKVFDFTGLQNLNLPARPEAVKRAQAFIVEHLLDGSLKPVIAKRFALDQIVEAHRFLESNQQVGKIVVVV